jgi:hypothetical protein
MDGPDRPGYGGEIQGGRRTLESVFGHIETERITGTSCTFRGLALRKENEAVLSCGLHERTALLFSGSKYLPKQGKQGIVKYIITLYVHLCKAGDQGSDDGHENRKKQASCKNMQALLRGWM